MKQYQLCELVKSAMDVSDLSVKKYVMKQVNFTDVLEEFCNTLCWLRSKDPETTFEIPGKGIYVRVTDYQIPNVFMHFIRTGNVYVSSEMRVKRSKPVFQYQYEEFVNQSGVKVGLMTPVQFNTFVDNCKFKVASKEGKIEHCLLADVHAIYDDTGHVYLSSVSELGSVEEALAHVKIEALTPYLQKCYAESKEEVINCLRSTLF